MANWRNIFKFDSRPRIQSWLAAASTFFIRKIAKPSRDMRLLEINLSAPNPFDSQKPPQADVEFGAQGIIPGINKPSPRTFAWSPELLQQLDSRHFEELVAAYFREESFRTESIRIDDGVDIELYEKNKKDIYALVHCRACNSRIVGVRPIRELLGTMIHENVTRGIFVTTSDYTAETVAFAKQHPIILITGEMLVTDILSYADDAKTRLANILTEAGFNLPNILPEAIPTETNDSRDAAAMSAPNMGMEVDENAASPAPIEDDSAEFDFAAHEFEVDSVAAAIVAEDEVAVDIPVVPAVEPTTLDFPLVVPNASPDNAEAEKPSISKSGTHEESNALDFPILEFNFNKDALQNETPGNKPAPDDGSEKESGTIDFPSIEHPTTEQATTTKPPDFFGVIR